MMTRKDYVQVAKILNAYHLDIDPQTFEDLLSDFHLMFKQDNKNFNYEKFRDAVLS